MSSFGWEGEIPARNTLWTKEINAEAESFKWLAGYRRGRFNRSNRRTTMFLVERIPGGMVHLERVLIKTAQPAVVRESAFLLPALNVVLPGHGNAFEVDPSGAFQQNQFARNGGLSYVVVYLLD